MPKSRNKRKNDNKKKAAHRRLMRKHGEHISAKQMKSAFNAMREAFEDMSKKEK